jgi:hypothetical protein
LRLFKNPEGNLSVLEVLSADPDPNKPQSDDAPEGDDIPQHLEDLWLELRDLIGSEHPHLWRSRIVRQPAVIP